MTLQQSPDGDDCRFCQIIGTGLQIVGVEHVPALHPCRLSVPVNFRAALCAAPHRERFLLEALSIASTWPRDPDDPPMGCCVTVPELLAFTYAETVGQVRADLGRLRRRGLARTAPCRHGRGRYHGLRVGVAA